VSGELSLFDYGLTVAECDRLTALEQTIERGLQTFVEVGNALLEIRDSRLYKQFGTFEDYCRERWGMQRNYANKMIAAAEVVGNLGTIVPILPVTESQARPLTALEPDLQRIAWQRAVDTAPDGKVTAAHVASVVDSFVPLRLAAANHVVSDDPDYDGDEWYTPADYIEAARCVMGGIDLDPASCDAAQETIQAGTYYTKQDDGLAMPWSGRVWLNPPYSTPLIRHFVSKLIEEYYSGNVTEAVILTNNSSDTGWFHDLLSRYPACFTRGRVQFWRPNHDDFGARQGQTLFYLGSNVTAFRDTFSQFGQVVGRL
jgi:phage N-6-adenine-methyltransferase